MIYNYIKVGQWRKPFGTKGHIRLQIEDTFAEQIEDATVLFAQHHGTHVPYFVQRVDTSNGIIVKVEEVDSPEETTLLSGQPCYMREQDLEMDDIVTDDEYAMLIGLTLVDGSPRGEIRAIVDYPQQKMMEVITPSGQLVLVPLASELILNIDETSVEVSLAENFWEIFG